VLNINSQIKLVKGKKLSPCANEKEEGKENLERERGDTWTKVTVSGG